MDLGEGAGEDLYFPVKWALFRHFLFFAFAVLIS